MPALTSTARTTGLLYLGLGIAGGLGFLLLRPLLFTEGDPAATLSRLIEHEALARAAVAAELLTVLTHSLAALWFFRLFRTVDRFAAGAIAAFGLVNAIVVLGSSALLATAVQVAHAPPAGATGAAGDPAATVQVLFLVSGNLWGVGGLFFGLWLIPMGRCVLRSGTMPSPLGWLLVAGGVGYVLSTLLGNLAPDARPVADALVVPATIGELWMIGYLLIRGFRPAGAREAGGPLWTPEDASRRTAAQPRHP